MHINKGTKMLAQIQQRQSIRKYQDTSIEEEKLTEVLRAGMNAPSARNTQSTTFMVITNRQALDEMVTLQPYMGMMKQAPCAIMVLGNRQREETDAYLYINGAAAIENMLIEAVHQGLSTCWCAIGPREDRIQKFQAYYALDEHTLPIAAIAIGYGNETKEWIDRFDPEKITYYK